MDTAGRPKNLPLKRRTELVFLGFMACFLVLVGRLAWIQWWQHPRFASMAARVHVRKIPVPAARGVIRARDGQELASNILATDVCANPKALADPAATAKAVAELFGGDAEQYRTRLESARNLHFVYLKRGVDRDLAIRHKKALKERPELKGIELRPAPRRTYPGGSLAAALLGYTDIDGNGIEGLELFYNRVLAGKDGHIVAEVDAKQQIIPDTERQVLKPVDGRDIVLTIDATLQQFAEAELQKAVDLYKPEGATVIVMDVRSGDVLALANAPGYDPNKPGSVPAEHRRCRAITDVYEPGSTFKVITAAAALEERIDTNAYCGGSRVVGPHVIRCAHGRAHGQCDLSRTIEQSCNISSGALAERIGAERLYHHIKQFGFLEKTGVELAGETSGWMGKWQEWRQVRTVNIGFGQGVVATPMQMLRAYAAIANDGVLVRPRIVSRIGEKLLESKDVPRRVMSMDNSRALRAHMERVVTDGTGKQAKIAHYSAAGKTGTAQIAQGGHYLAGVYFASFIGFVPASQPRLAILVAVRHPKGAQYGGVVAAPVFREVSRQAMAYMQISPDSPNDERDGAVLGSYESWKRRNGVTTSAADTARD